MNIIQKLLYRNRSRLDRNQKVRGLSTAELVGIIVIVGILGAIGGTYITGLVTQASKNSIAQNASTLNTLYASATAAGAVLGTGAGQLNLASAQTAVDSFNAGVKDSTGTVNYQMTPPATDTSYTISGAPIVFSPAPNATTP